ncbi:disulfide bond formation protein B [Streptomyces sp. NPDC096033]|uniref:disulfide bond formation protein B n=1 Tax=Streptomyces sp. NPDC096033 TaxID=3366071 RepID=UPI00381619C6
MSTISEEPRSGTNAIADGSGSGSETGKRWSPVLRKIGFVFPHVYVLGMCGVLFGGFFMQFGQAEYPCPLCMLERVGMMLSALGPMWILLRARRFGRIGVADLATGYGFAVVASILSSFISARHVLLHVNDTGYGGMVLHLHTYTWAWITFMLAAIASGLMLAFQKYLTPGEVRFGRASRATLWIFGIFLVANLVSSFVQEGLHPLYPGNPFSYELLHLFG